MHFTDIIPALTLLSTANAALMLGTSSSGGTYTWLRGQTPCGGTYLDPICGIDFTVPGGGAAFQYEGCNNATPNLPQYNERNGNFDANCALLTEGTHTCGGSINVMTTYAICNSAD